MLLAAVAALSLGNVAGGHMGTPATMADLLRSAELKEQLDKREWLQLWAELAVQRTGSCRALGFAECRTGCGVENGILLLGSRRWAWYWLC